MVSGKKKLIVGLSRYLDQYLFISDEYLHRYRPIFIFFYFFEIDFSIFYKKKPLKFLKKKN